jgi:hypothetical protein
MKVRNQQLLKRPWLFSIYTIIGGALTIYFAAPPAQNTDVIAVAVGVVAVINIWFFVSLRQTLRSQKPPES